MSEIFAVDNPSNELLEYIEKSESRAASIDLIVRLLGRRILEFFEIENDERLQISSKYKENEIVLDSPQETKKFFTTRCLSTEDDQQPSMVAEGYCYAINQDSKQKALLVVSIDPINYAELVVWDQKETLPLL